MFKQSEKSLLPISNLQIRRNSDYQVFDFDHEGRLRNPKGRLDLKLKAFSKVLPKDFTNHTVLDIGCDFGFWSFYSALNGAKEVLGIDRNREVRGQGIVNLVDLNTEVVEAFPKLYGVCKFQECNIGHEFPDIGQFDIVYMCSLYHHIYNNVREHAPIFEWLKSCCRGFVIFENPIDLTDSVARQHVKFNKENYNREAIEKAYTAVGFTRNFEGPALHEKTRIVWRLQA